MNVLLWLGRRVKRGHALFAVAAHQALQRFGQFGMVLQLLCGIIQRVERRFAQTQAVFARCGRRLGHDFGAHFDNAVVKLLHLREQAGQNHAQAGSGHIVGGQKD